MMKRDALFNMIEQQIRPWNVLDPEVLQVLRFIPRIGFLPQSHKAFAYMDTELPLVIEGVDTHTYLLAPKVLARMLQTLRPQKNESVGQIGLGDGYLTALLAHFAQIVTVYELDERILKFAQNNLNVHKIRNVNYELANGLKSSTEKFDVLILSGSVVRISEEIKHKINIKGRLLAIVGEADAPVMFATLVERVSENAWKEQIVFETYAPPLVDKQITIFSF